jgi:tetratricopeptide repeat protein 8
LEKPLASGQNAGGISQMIRPVSNTGRPITGYSRPGTNRPVTGSKNALQTALSGNRPTTASRPVTSGGRYLRLGTASLIEQGNKFIDPDRLNPKRIAGVKSVAKV